MPAVRRVAVLLLAGLALAGCGGSGHKSSSDTDQIKSAYARFFSAKTSLSDRVALLQNGPSLPPVRALRRTGCAVAAGGLVFCA